MNQASSLFNSLFQSLPNSALVKDHSVYFASLVFWLPTVACPRWCSGSTNSLHNLQMAAQGQQPDLSRRQQDDDIFSIVGGCELGADSRLHPLQQARNNVSTNSLGSAAGLPNSSSVGNLSCLGDLPEEQPSRILFIRGLDATVSDEALVQMFEVCVAPLWAYCCSCCSCTVLILIQH